MTSTSGSKLAGKPIDQSFIQSLLSESRTRGDYNVILEDFYKSGEPGIMVDLNAGSLVGKDASNVYQGFNNAKKKLHPENHPNAGTLVYPWGPKIKVIKKNLGGSGKEGEASRDDQVFLINTELVEGVSPESETDEPVNENEDTEVE